MTPTSVVVRCRHALQPWFKGRSFDGGHGPSVPSVVDLHFAGSGDMLARGLFRFAEFRGPTRDVQSDLQRAETVRGAVTEALSGIDAEMAGLGRRVEELRGWVGSLMGPEDRSSSRRDVAAEAELVEAERRLMAGLDRLVLLREMRAGYSVVMQASDSEHDRASAACLPAA